MKTELEFKLETPVAYQCDGGNHQGSLLILKAPSNKVRAHRARLKQAFMQAIAEGEDRGAKDSPEVKDPEAQKDVIIEDDEMGGYVLMMLYAAKNINIVEIIEEFKSLLVHGKCCRVEGSVDMTSSIFDSMDADDSDRLMGEYLANFILASFLSKVQTK